MKTIIRKTLEFNGIKVHKDKDNCIYGNDQKLDIDQYQEMLITIHSRGGLILKVRPKGKDNEEIKDIEYEIDLETAIQMVECEKIELSDMLVLK